MNAATIGWGCGLVILGLAIGSAGYVLLTNYRGYAERYYESVRDAGTTLPVLGPRYRRMDLRVFKNSLGIGLVLFGAFLIALGTYGLSRL